MKPVTPLGIALHTNWLGCQNRTRGTHGSGGRPCLSDHDSHARDVWYYLSDIIGLEYDDFGELIIPMREEDIPSED